MLDILLHHWATFVYLGWLLVVILGNVLTWKTGGNLRRRTPFALGSHSRVQSGSEQACAPYRSGLEHDQGESAGKAA